ncbi:TRAP transporter large permease [bacterium]|nr:TRAP transporter large permease [bacterium]
MEWIELIGMGLVVVLFLTGSPLAIAFSVGSIVVLTGAMGFPIPNVAQLFFSSINSYSLLAMPFFILAGNLLLRSGGMVPLRDFMAAMVGHWPGGMAVATIIFAAFLGSISGSAAACLAIIGTVMVPILVKSGYDRPFSSGIAVTAAELGMLIPPSLFFIIFGAFNRVSIADLFMGGIGPGVLSAFLMCLVAVFISRRRKYQLSPKASLQVRWQTTVRVIPILLMPVIVLGGIYSGIFSPTQAASISVLYTLIIGFFIYRKLTVSDLTDSLVSTVRLSSMIYLMYIGGDLFGKTLGYIGLPQLISEWVISLELEAISFLIVVELLLLVMGFFFSSIPMVVIVLPLFLPAAMELGIDPVFYGVLSIFCSLIGEITPPMGPQLWIAAPICNERMGAIAREAWPFLGAQVVALFLTTAFPQIAMYLVDLMR